MDGKILAAIQSLLRKKIGLDASTLGSSVVIEKAAIDRMNDNGILDVPTYLMHLQTSPQEWDALIEKVIVPETWFFRDREAFNFLRQYILSEWLPHQSSQCLRVLSVPCSTGEEPYSIAMTLLEAGLTPNQFRIDAVDISKSSLLTAKRGIYGKNSFRGQSFALPSSQGFILRVKYFESRLPADNYQIFPSVKKTVNFISGNLIDPCFRQTLSRQTLSEKYQIIFCRNLLIYFARDSRAKAIEMIDRLLSSQGLLFVGSAETGALMGQGFTSVRHPMSFAYRKTETKLAKIKNQSIVPTVKKDFGSINKAIKLTDSAARTGVTPRQLIRQQYQTKPEINRETTPQQNQHNIPDKPADCLIENARTLANRGQLQSAAKLCQTYLTQHPTSVPGYVLLGEVYQALENDDRAEQCFQKAVYLDPKHYEALVHLVLLREQRGDISNAAVLRQRIQRLENQ